MSALLRRAAFLVVTEADRAHCILLLSAPAARGTGAPKSRGALELELIATRTMETYKYYSRARELP